jgi:ABC-type nitrate/sulfonate/bicarbonate transport system substrate-binding protein
MNLIHHRDENLASGLWVNIAVCGMPTANGAAQVRITSSKSSKPRPQGGTQLRLGFIALNDCAPLAVAKEMGIFDRHGVRVTLRREVGWATIREKILFGELDAAHAPGGMVLAATCGLGSAAQDCLTALVLNLHGNAIVLSERLHREGVRDGATLRAHVRHTGERLTFGVVYQWSSHHVLLLEWLRTHGLVPGKDAEIVIVPPSQVFSNLRAGNLDGYCVGEPWGSMAVLHRCGWVVATSRDLAPGHPEKVLMVRRTFAERSHQEHLALVAALLEACAFCQDPENHEDLIALLARKEYVGAPAEALRPGITGRLPLGHGKIDQISDFTTFGGPDANAPTADKGNWVLDCLVRSGLIPSLPAHLLQTCFRPDLFQAATRLTATV